MNSKDNPFLASIRRDVAGGHPLDKEWLNDDIANLLHPLWPLIWNMPEASIGHRVHAIRVLKKLAAL